MHIGPEYMHVHQGDFIKEFIYRLITADQLFEGIVENLKILFWN